MADFVNVLIDPNLGTDGDPNSGFVSVATPDLEDVKPKLEQLVNGNDSSMQVSDRTDSDRSSPIISDPVDADDKSADPDPDPDPNAEYFLDLGQVKLEQPEKNVNGHQQRMCEGDSDDRDLHEPFSTVNVEELLSRIQLLESQVTLCLQNQPLIFQEVNSCKMVEERLNVLEGDIDERLEEINERIDRAESGLGSSCLCPCRLPSALASIPMASPPASSSIPEHQHQSSFLRLPSPAPAQLASQTLQKQSNHVITSFFKTLNSKASSPSSTPAAHTGPTTVPSSDTIEKRGTKTSVSNFEGTVWPESGEKFAGRANLLHQTPISHSRGRNLESGQTIPSVASRVSMRSKTHASSYGLDSTSNTSINNSQKRICPKCGKVCSKSSNLLRHIRLVHIQRRLQCEFCEASYRDKRDLKKHQEKVHDRISMGHTVFGSEAVECPGGCGLTFRRAQHLLLHTNTCQMRKRAIPGSGSEQGPTHFEAMSAIGESTSTTPSSLSQVLPLLRTKQTSGRRRKGNVVQDNTCKRCGKTFKRPDHLLRHSRMHQASKARLLCKFCSAPFTRTQNLNLHINDCQFRQRQKNHRDDPQLFKDGGRECSLHCKFCPPSPSQIFEDAEGLANHYTSQHPIPPTLTASSEIHKPAHDLETRGNSARQEHMIRNRGGRCLKCRKYFKNIRDHLEIHKPDYERRRHSCTICGKSFARRSDLTRHMYTHTGNRPFECKDCGKKFWKKSILKTHDCANIDIVQQRHGCDECGMYFPAETFLTSHKKTSHAKERAVSLIPKQVEDGGEGSRESPSPSPDGLSSV